jgi:hypothetical protein
MSFVYFPLNHFSFMPQPPNGLRYRRLGEPTHETEPNSSLKSSSKRGAHQPSGARFVGRILFADIASVKELSHPVI